MQELHDTCISDRYRLLKRLRRGGMSEVFLACDEQTQQQVALKIVTTSNTECLKRLQREVNILRGLSHPHIVPLLDDGIAGSSYYLAMPYMQGGNLRDRLARGTFPPEEAAILLHQLADALSCAHAHGIIHRDIKPSNILLDNEQANHIYLADFGIATILGQGSDITRTGFLVGTPEYMAPELAEKPESESSDIYAIGVLLYHMLTGRLPFTGTTPLAICWKHIKEQPAPPSNLNPDISPAIEQVILRAMHKNPRLRFSDAGSLSLAYANALSGLDEMSGVHLVPSIELPVLQPAQVDVRRMGKSFVHSLPATFRQLRVGKVIQRGALSVAALLLIALPASLGFMVARNGAELSQPAAITRAFTGTTLAGKVQSPLKATTLPSGGGMSTPTSKTDLSTHLHVHSSHDKDGGEDQGQKHKHGGDD